MTIAACHLSSEGVVFGADSTSTMFIPGPNPVSGSNHYFDYAQKIFEIGTNSYLAVCFWGMGNIADLSFRTLVATFADELDQSPASSMAEIADKLTRFFWDSYTAKFQPTIDRLRFLESNPNRTPDESQEILLFYNMLSGGFCLGGCCLPDRTPHAFEITYHPGLTLPATPRHLQYGDTSFWGIPNLIDRLIYGMDDSLFNNIASSSHWIGTRADLFDLLRSHMLTKPLNLPIRDAIDWVHASIYTTIKSLKFSHFDPMCGGPIEISVISTDRPFRWVMHKRLDSAISRLSWPED